MPDNGPSSPGRFLIKGRWIGFTIAFAFGFVGWLPVLAGALISGLGYQWASDPPPPHSPILQVVGAAISAYLFVVIVAPFRVFAPVTPKKDSWRLWYLLYAGLTFLSAAGAGAAFRIALPFIPVYACTTALCAGAIEMMWLKPWQPGPSDELIAARLAALQRGEDPSKITEDNTR